jgi:hypothetical protein
VRAATPANNPSDSFEVGFMGVLSLIGASNGDMFRRTSQPP